MDAKKQRAWLWLFMRNVRQEGISPGSGEQAKPSKQAGTMERNVALELDPLGPNSCKTLASSARE